MPNETFDLLFDLGIPIEFLHGNGELAVLAQIAARDDPSTVTYWGTTGGDPPPESARVILQWTAQQLRAAHAERISSWPKTVRLPMEGIGDVLFCHGTPRSEVECFTRLTPEDLLRPVFDGIEASLVICGHTHMQFDRTVGRIRVVNAGSVGMPFQGPPGAYWVLLDRGVELRYTPYHLDAAADRVRITCYPQAEDFATRNILSPPREADMLDAFTSASFR
jgi:diadenosine tetraphosphatase ApaH/serine/threonine PP2A family protein phosphatase